jgi:hypothetical protein
VSEEIRIESGELVNLTTGEIRLPSLPQRITIPYSKQIGEFIADRVAEGKRLSEVAKMNGVPNLSVIMRWLRDHPEFEEEYTTALKARAINSVENIFNIENDARYAEKDDVPGLKLSFEASKFIAERLDRERFSPKSSGDVGGINIQINTGIVREKDDRDMDDILSEVSELGSGI